jgi:cytochrome b involved in lipid metabolism
MGKGSEDSNNQITNQLFQWNEIKRHNTKNDLWIVIDGCVYDITKFQKKHPGGHKVINFYSGQDATVSFKVLFVSLYHHYYTEQNFKEAFIAFHKDQGRTRKYMNMYRIGRLDEFSDDESLMKINKNRQNEMKVDFENLRKLAVEMVRSAFLIFDFIISRISFKNLFKPNYFFYFLHGFHIIFLHLLGFYILNKFGSGILPILSAFICHTIAKVISMNFDPTIKINTLIQGSSRLESTRLRSFVSF